MVYSDVNNQSSYVSTYQPLPKRPKLTYDTSNTGLPYSSLPPTLGTIKPLETSQHVNGPQSPQLSNSIQNTKSESIPNSSKSKKRKSQKPTPDGKLILQDGIYVRESVELIHYIDKDSVYDPNDVRTQKPVNSICEENILLLSTLLAINNLEISSVPRNILSGNVNQAIPCSIAGMGYPFHVIRLIGLITSSELKEINNSLIKISSICQTTDYSESIKQGKIHPYQNILRKCCFTFGYTSDGMINGNNYEPKSLSNGLSGLEEEDIILKLNYGLFPKILHRICKHLINIQPELTYTMRAINDFSFNYYKNVLNGGGGNNKNKLFGSKTMNKLRYGGLGTTIKIGLSENLIPTYPHIEQDHGESPSIILQLSGPKSIIRFPQLHTDVELNTGNFIIAPLRILLHHSVIPSPQSQEQMKNQNDCNSDKKECNNQNQNQKRLIVMIYTKKSIEDAFNKSDDRDQRIHTFSTKRLKHKGTKSGKSKHRGNKSQGQEVGNQSAQSLGEDDVEDEREDNEDDNDNDNDNDSDEQEEIDV
ncbi:uncharacterized protein L201_003233 [Kwoniella dendrophila CBS 6074]|uniref:Uncharacterized protein n=1 Tax=Kwoniella dendrophila CBS 6074 TaxID=1295534 RepID=A0AAX4JTR0_9TREE